MRDLTPEHRTAVAYCAQTHGRYWKRALRQHWERASATPILHGLRNSHGPAWLVAYRLPAAPARRVLALDDAQRWVDANGPTPDVPGSAVHTDPEPWPP